MQYLRLASLAAVLVFFAACNPLGTPFGPVNVDVAMEGGTVDTSALPEIPTGMEVTAPLPPVDFCSIPSEQEIIDQIPDLGPIDLGNYVRLTSLDIESMTLTATEGDFSFVREIVVDYIPKTNLGIPQQPIEIGRASSDTGFGTTITLTPSQDVDFLDIIRENDDNPSPGCPQIQVTLTATQPDDPVTWTAEATIAVSGLIGG